MPPLRELPPLPPGYRITVGHGEANAVAAHEFLVTSHWSPGIPFETVARAIEHSLCATAQYQGRQVGMARLVTDYATFAWLADVYVLDGHRRRGLALAMVAALQDHPDLLELRRWLLATRDGQPLYARLGWHAPAHPERIMTREFPDIYGPVPFSGGILQ